MSRDFRFAVYSKFIQYSEEYNWERVPLVFFRNNAQEIPLIKKVKGLQDALNTMLSDFPNAMEENAGGQSILIIKNYGIIIMI